VSTTTDTIARINLRLNEMLGLVPPQWQWTCQACRSPATATATDYEKSSKGTCVSVSSGTTRELLTLRMGMVKPIPCPDCDDKSTTTSEG